MPSKLARGADDPPRRGVNRLTVKSSRRPLLAAAHLQGFHRGLHCGVAASFVFMRASESLMPVASPDTSAPSGQVEEAPRFDFYTVLPNQALDPQP